jgi:riboflavin kinase / FMN adenylyltransferase
MVEIHFDLTAVRKPTAIALGNFDGVHCGHQRLVERLMLSMGEAVPTVVTFDPHPQDFFSGEQRQLLTTITEKAYYLGKLGIAQLVVLPFDRTMVELTPTAFVEKVIVTELAAQRVTIGADFRFGYQRQGNAEILQELTAQRGIVTEILALEQDRDSRIGSSRIRAALLQGDLEEAKRLLQRSYSISGAVVSGQQLGRTLGFPTANIAFDSQKFLPRLGVYCVRIDTANQSQLAAVANVGKRPTVDGQQVSLEVHLLDWAGDLYGQSVTVYLDRFLRSEQKFAGLTELTAQIRADCQAAQSFYGQLGNTGL